MEQLLGNSFQNVAGVLELVATLLFIYGLKGLASPKTAQAGNRSAMIAMGIAVLVTLFRPEVKIYHWILPGMFLGAIVGIFLARKIQMTAMPQLVAILHSFVGLSAVLVAVGSYLEHAAGVLHFIEAIELGLGVAIGAVTFSGSLIAFGKLQELLGSKPLHFKGQHAFNLFLLSGILGCIALFGTQGTPEAFWVMTAASFLLGFLLVLPIGGADMPVVVSMLNSYSGWAASATGFILHNQLLIITGALVGSSGAILSYIMCKAMNRSIWNVILGGFGTDAAGSDASNEGDKTVRSAAVEDVAFMLENASKVIFVPGYGMAVAQAQHAIKELFGVLQKKGVEVKFAIHPVAGRMPGHMNVLLAESEIPYDVVFEMEEINAEFGSADVAFVVGANDVVNPAAKSDTTSPLYGMPILDVYKAKQIFVSKRSMKAGYAGVDNGLFYYPNCSLVFGDAKTTCEKIVKALQESH